MSQKILKHAKKHGTPLIDGQTATFVWKGVNPPRLIGDFSDWDEGDPLPWTQVSAKVWTAQLTLPADAYIEYAYIEGGGRLSDPFNPCTISHGLGKGNHYFYMPEAARTSLSRKQPDVPRGTVTRYRLGTEDLLAGETRSVYLYQPPTLEPSPLLVVWDGRDYHKRARLATILDNLIDQGRIRPLAMAMIQNGNSARTAEYACSEASLVFLLNQVLPLARDNLNLWDTSANPGSFGILGASMGGLMALYAGLRLPHIFGRVLSQSGAFSLDGVDLIVYDLVGRGASYELKIWMDVGSYDSPSLLESNQRMYRLLLDGGYEVAYREYHAGHNYPAWRNDVWRGLEYLFGNFA